MFSDYFLLAVDAFLQKELKFCASKGYSSKYFCAQYTASSVPPAARQAGFTLTFDKSVSGLHVFGGQLILEGCELIKFDIINPPETIYKSVYGGITSGYMPPNSTVVVLVNMTNNYASFHFAADSVYTVDEMYNRASNSGSHQLLPTVPGGLHVNNIHVPWGEELCITPDDIVHWETPIDECAVQVCSLFDPIRGIESTCVLEPCKISNVTVEYDIVNGGVSTWPEGYVNRFSYNTMLFMNYQRHGDDIPAGGSTTVRVDFRFDETDAADVYQGQLPEYGNHWPDLTCGETIMEKGNKCIWWNRKPAIGPDLEYYILYPWLSDEQNLYYCRNPDGPDEVGGTAEKPW
eukprot:gene6643-7954_t